MKNYTATTETNNQISLTMASNKLRYPSPSEFVKNNFEHFKHINLVIKTAKGDIVNNPLITSTNLDQVIYQEINPQLMLKAAKSKDAVYKYMQFWLNPCRSTTANVKIDLKNIYMNKDDFKTIAPHAALRRSPNYIVSFIAATAMTEGKFDDENGIFNKHIFEAWAKNLDARNITPQLIGSISVYEDGTYTDGFITKIRQFIASSDNRKPGNRN